jgi:hypothetical protein
MGASVWISSKGEGKRRDEGSNRPRGWSMRGRGRRCSTLIGQDERRKRTWVKRREEETRLRQRVKGHGASSLARVQGRRRLVGSGGRRRTDARQVFDA